MIGGSTRVGQYDQAHGVVAMDGSAPDEVHDDEGSNGANFDRACAKNMLLHGET